MHSINGLLTVALVGLAGLLAVPIGGAAGSEAWNVRPGVGVGPILLGASPAAVRALLGAPDEIHERVYVYARQAHISFGEDDTVRAIYLSSGPDFTQPVPFAARTPEGIGFGSTRSAVDAWLGKELRVVPMAGARGIEVVEPAAGGILVTLYYDKVVELIVVPLKSRAATRP